MSSTLNEKSLTNKSKSRSKSQSPSISFSTASADDSLNKSLPHNYNAGIIINKRQPPEEDISSKSPSPIFKKRKVTITRENDKPVSKLSPIQPQKVRPKSTRAKIPRKCITC